MDEDGMKRKLRDLKKLETRIRFEGMPGTGRRKMVWNEFFSTRELNDGTVRYSLLKLLSLDKAELKAVFEEYFYHVYYRKYEENGINFNDMYDPGLLSVLGLQPGVEFAEIKRRFRELAKKYHPDCGGDSAKMVELLEAYHKLADKG